MNRFSRCPKCAEHGKDTSGDNLYTYEDGGQYCFACHYWKSSSKFSPPAEKTEPTPPPLDLKEPWPAANRNWLRQFITDEEIDEFYYYSSAEQRHIFATFNKTFDGDSVYWEGRSVKQGVSPKVISHGAKPFYLFGQYKETRTVVVVEDLVSAIKLSPVVGVLPLFGSNLPPNWMVNLARNNHISFVLMWLDADKYEEALTFAEKQAKLGVNTAVICTERDPKWHSHAEIKEIIAPYGGSL